MPRAKPSQALFTDLYLLTMAEAYWQSGNTAQATFSLFFRKYPPDRSYYVFAGLPDVLEFLEQFRFSGDDIALLRSLRQLSDDFLDYLSRVRFTGSLRAMDEATIFFSEEPVIEVTGPIIETQLVETFLLNQVSVQSTLATKAARVVQAAAGKSVVDFAARRTHGMDAANKLARTSFMVGFDGTSNVLAGARYGIPTFGTMAHSFVISFQDELEAFRAYAESFPDASTFLVDTYDTVEGTRRAIEVGREMRRKGRQLRAVRLDSGDLLDLSLKTRALLDEAGLAEVQVVASGGLDEHRVDDLLSAGAPIDGFGVGTKVGVSADAPWTDFVYKLVEYDARPVLKLSSDKQTLPGPKQVYRLRDRAGLYSRDIVACAAEPPPEEGAEPLLGEVMEEGRRVVCLPTLSELRERFREKLAPLPERHKALTSPAPYEVAISDQLQKLSADVRERQLRVQGLQRR